MSHEPRTFTSDALGLDEFLYLPFIPASIQRTLARPLAAVAGRSS